MTDVEWSAGISLFYGQSETGASETIESAAYAWFIQHSRIHRHPTSRISDSVQIQA